MITSRCFAPPMIGADFRRRLVAVPDEVGPRLLIKRGRYGDKRRTTMAKRALCVASVLLMLASTPSPGVAEFAGTVRRDEVVVVGITTVNGSESGATIFLLAGDKVQDVISLSAAFGETHRVELPITRNARRIIVLVDVPPGGNTRVTISADGGPVFPDATISEDKRYTLNVR
jgi:hypothetical protein